MQFRTPPQNMIPQEACSEIPCHRHPRGVWVKSKLSWKIGKNLENPWGAKLIADEDRSSRRCPFVGSNFHCHVMFSSVRSVEDKMIDDGGCRPASLKIYCLVRIAGIDSDSICALPQRPNLMKWLNDLDVIWWRSQTVIQNDKWYQRMSNFLTMCEP